MKCSCDYLGINANCKLTMTIMNGSVRFLIKEVLKKWLSQFDSCCRGCMSGKGAKLGRLMRINCASR